MSACRSISQDRLFYCYWCCYLVRYNWIVKTLHHSFIILRGDISIRLLTHIRVDTVKCKCVMRCRNCGAECDCGVLCGCVILVQLCNKGSRLNHAKSCFHDGWRSPAIPESLMNLCLQTLGSKFTAMHLFFQRQNSFLVQRHWFKSILF